MSFKQIPPETLLDFFKIWMAKHVHQRSSLVVAMSESDGLL